MGTVREGGGSAIGSFVSVGVEAWDAGDFTVRGSPHPMSSAMTIMKPRAATFEA
jgi:hypothetical protein